MAVIGISEFRADQSIVEHRVGSAGDKITYPGMQQCICITGYNNFGLVGAHISPNPTDLKEMEENLLETFRLLKTGGGQSCIQWYIVGDFNKHFTSMRVKIAWWKTTQKIASTLRTQVNKGASVVMFDTGAIAKNYGYGVNIIATRQSNSVSFAYQKSGTGRGNPIIDITAPFVRL